MKVYEEAKAEAIRTNATIIVRGSVPSYRIENMEANVIIAGGFVTRAAAERCAKTIRDQQAGVPAGFDSDYQTPKIIAVRIDGKK